MPSVDKFLIEIQCLTALCDAAGFSLSEISFCYPIKNNFDLSHPANLIKSWLSQALVLCELKKHGAKGIEKTPNIQQSINAGGILSQMLKDACAFLDTCILDGQKFLSNLRNLVGLSKPIPENLIWPSLALATFADGNSSNLPCYDFVFIEKLIDSWKSSKLENEHAAKLVLISSILCNKRNELTDKLLYELAEKLIMDFGVPIEKLDRIGKKEDQLSKVLTHQLIFIERPGLKHLRVEKTGVIAIVNSIRYQISPVVLGAPLLSDFLMPTDSVPNENQQRLLDIKRLLGFFVSWEKLNIEQRLFANDITNDTYTNSVKPSVTTQKKTSVVKDQLPKISEPDLIGSLVKLINQEIASISSNEKGTTLIQAWKHADSLILTKSPELLVDPLSAVLLVCFQETISPDQSNVNNGAVKVFENIQNHINEIGKIKGIQFEFGSSPSDESGGIKQYAFNDIILRGQPFLAKIGWIIKDGKVNPPLWLISSGKKPKDLDNLIMSVSKMPSIANTTKPLLDRWSESVARGIFDFDLAPKLLQTIFGDRNLVDTPTEQFKIVEKLFNECLREQAGLELFKRMGGTLGSHPRREVEAVNAGSQMNVRRMVFPGLKYTDGRILEPVKVEVD
jgi:hypothetical protein